MKLFVRILVVCLGLTFFGACFEDPDCIGLRNDVILVSFKKLFDRKADTIVFFSATVSGTDSLFHSSTQAIALPFPLNVNSSSQLINFETSQGNFSLDLGYNTSPQFEDVDCGPRFVLSNLSLLQHNFDSARVVNATPSANGQVNNIDIYRCPYTDLLKIGFRQLLANDDSIGQALDESLNGVSVDFFPAILYADQTLSSFVVPANLTATSSQITIDHATKGLGSLTVTYDVIQSELFKVCGAQRFVHNIDVVDAGYDKVIVRKDSLTDPPSTNILLQRCPRTNLIKLVLKSDADSGATDVQIVKVTTGFNAEEYYVNQSVSTLELPLDLSQDLTDYTIEFEDGPKQISFEYIRTQQVFHEQCDQTLFSSLKVLASDFTSELILKSDSVQFPTVVNFEIIND